MAENRSRSRSFLARAVVALGFLTIASGASAAGLLAWFSRDLPRFDALKDYAPIEATHVIAADGTEVAAFGEELRTVVTPQEIPEVMKRSILAAEDARFYQHEGLDYGGIARAAIKNLLPGGHLQGASTITQQVVKTFLLSPERSLRRKIPEMILALRLEKNLSKDEILYLYLNQIYFGHRRYGVQEASRYFFDKPVRELGLEEASLLAGLVQSPARLSPINHPERAKQRQIYVLGRMLENGWITRADHDRAVEAPLPLAPRRSDAPGDWYVEEVRRYLVDRYGEEQVLTAGLTVSIGMDPARQAQAEAALRANILEYDRRHGFRGPTGKLDPAARAALPAARPGELVDVEGGKPVALREGAIAAGWVQRADARAAVVSFGGPTAVFAAGEAWPGKELPRLAEGDVVRCQLGPEVKGKRTATLWQEPDLEGALVALDPRTREVRALVGGYDPARSAFDRATQARRQPGSAFKPFVFGAALESGRWSPASLVVDAPETFRDPWTGKDWKPQNFEKNEFDGTLTLRRALALSKNTVAVRLISELGVAPVIDFARRAGIHADLPGNFTLALGTGEVTPLELANAYGTLAAGGVYADPILVTKVVSRDGTVLEENRARPRPVISPALAYVITRLLQGVVQEGTGRAAAVIERPLAGKTGTTSDGKDAWFAGYTPDLVAVTWVGFDDHARSLGRNETGARAALPGFVSFVQAAVQGTEAADFSVPEGVTSATIDPATGLLAPDGAVGEETAFVEGTAPTLHALAPGLAPADTPAELFLGGAP